MDTPAPWNAPHADAQTVDSWGGGTAVSAFPPLVPVNSNGSGVGDADADTYQCPTHPLFRTSDASSFCPHCETTWVSQRAELQSKRASVEEQLHNLQGVDSAAAILQDLQVSMKEWKPQPEDELPAAPSYGSGGQPPRAPSSFGNPSSEGNHPNNINNTNNNQPPQQHYGQQQQQQMQANFGGGDMPPPAPMTSPPMNGGGMPSSASFFPPFYQGGGGGYPGGGGGPPGYPGGGGGGPPGYPNGGGPPGSNNNNNGGMPAFAMQLHSMQRMQDWMLWRKEQECQQLRQSLEEMRTEVQQLRVDKALLQEKLYQQEERMKHELKLIKLAALQQQQQQQQNQQQNNHRNMKKGSAAGGSSGKQQYAASQSHSNNGNSQNSGSQNSAPVVLLPDHMLNGGSGKYPSVEASNSRPSQPPVQVTATPPMTSLPRTAASTSAFGTPPSPPKQQQPKTTNLSLASYQSAEEPISPPPAASETSSPAATKTVDLVSSPLSRASKATTEASSSPKAARAKTVAKTAAKATKAISQQQQPDSIERQVSNDSARSGSQSSRSRGANSKKSGSNRTAKSATSWITKLGRRKSPPEAAPVPAPPVPVPVDIDDLVDDDSSSDDVDVKNVMPNVQEEKKETAVEEQEEQQMDQKDGILSKMTSSDEDDSDYKAEESEDVNEEEEEDPDDLEDDMQQHPVVDMTDEDDFDALVRNADSTEMPADLISAVSSSVVTNEAPIQILQVNPTPTVPLQEQVTFGTKGTEEMPPPAASPSRGVSFPDDDDNASMGQTVASSTFGEDRQKVADQVILDPYGDKGTYTGIILRSTGMYVVVNWSLARA
jgi:hypothetical protein